MAKQRTRGKSRHKGRKYLIALGIVLAALALYFFTSPLFNYPVVKAIPGTFTLNDVIAVGKGVVAFAGAASSNNSSYGVAGEYFLQNSSYVFFNLGKYFKNGTIFSIAYNGSYFLLAGAQYIREGNLSVLQPEVVLYSDGRAINVSGLIPSFYTPGQAYVAAWTGSYWLVGGSALAIEGSAQYNVPFLVKIYPNMTSVDLTSDLPSYFYSPLSVGTGIYALATQGNLFAVGGSHLFNYTFAYFNGTSFSGLDQVGGSILALSSSPQGWIIGGFKYSSNPDVTLTMLGVVNGSGLHFVSLKYEVGEVVAVGYGDGEYAVSLRIPSVNEETNAVSEEGILLVGNSLSSLSEVYQGYNVSINSLTFVGGYIVGAGYEVHNQTREGVILILRAN